ncbi:SDR family oxidoreductase [Salinivibrio sp. YCSC6]|uniref:UDP-glucose 4-epimerase family protein n=1 Tax=Salinivibrio sp. YCSC6 TaxID=2003370 RepID=UPI000BBBA815|nr:SDR family oxidoreductase [Salinivibrio sp. YCSC6]PCE67648.1 NAD-dependent dehydratase [Salinivibrio sp. YCSC6]QCF35452.1 SDR family oxidoreductase [Salinivibrio sp. YCSC6]
MKLLITGSSGFVGKTVCGLATKQGHTVCNVMRKKSDLTQINQKCKQDSTFWVDSINADTNWVGAFDGVDCVVHCAARVHHMHENPADVLAAYRSINTEGTRHLAQQAAAGGVKRFVFISSIKVNGESTSPDQPFYAEDKPNPQDPYGISKYEAEQALFEIARQTGLEVVIVRPPLVYGPGVKANFLTMIKWIERRLPLPLGAIHNKRSMIYVDNLAELIMTCCVHPSAVGKVFLASDNEDVSVTRLLQTVAHAMGRRPCLLPIPTWILIYVAKGINRSEVSQRLCGSLQVDINKTMSQLNWRPTYTFEQGINKTVSDYLATKS